jgi:hypothetical protein
MKNDPKRLRYQTSTAFSLAAMALVLALGWGSPQAFAQNPANHDSPDTASGQRWQHLHQEDTGSSIDEVRVGGETQRLTVQPKSKLLNAPAYEFQPTNGARRSLATGPGAESVGSPRVWNFLSF